MKPSYNIKECIAIENIQNGSIKDLLWQHAILEMAFHPCHSDRSICSTLTRALPNHDQFAYQGKPLQKTTITKGPISPTATRPKSRHDNVESQWYICNSSSITNHIIKISHEEVKPDIGSAIRGRRRHHTPSPSSALDRTPTAMNPKCVKLTTYQPTAGNKHSVHSSPIWYHKGGGGIQA